MLIHPLQPSCDAQDAAICWQVDQMGHTSQQVMYNILLLKQPLWEGKQDNAWETRG